MEKKIVEKSMILIVEQNLIASKVREINDKAQNFIEEIEKFETIILDIKDVSYIDSVGITFIVAMYKIVSKQNKEFKLINTNEDIKDLFALMRLNEKFSIE
jgi:anti-anti-sigma factor